MKNSQSNSKKINISCQNLEKFIVDFLDGQLTPEINNAFIDHIKECEACEDYLEDYQQTISICKTVYSSDASTEKIDMPEKLVNAILETRKDSF